MKIKFITDILTEDDGTTYCWARVASSMGVISYIGNASYLLYKSGAIDMVQFATGFGIILAGAGAVIAAKAATQRDTDNQK